MKDGVVADHVNPCIATQPSAQFIQVCQEQIGVAFLAFGRDQITRRQFSEPAK